MQCYISKSVGFSCNSGVWFNQESDAQFNQPNECASDYVTVANKAWLSNSVSDSVFVAEYRK